MRWSSSRPGKGMSCPQQGFAQPPDERGFTFVPDVQLRTSLPSLFPCVSRLHGSDLLRCTSQINDAAHVAHRTLHTHTQRHWRQPRFPIEVGGGLEGACMRHA